MSECTLHNLLVSCQYPQVFWIYLSNNYDENILLAKGTKREMFGDADIMYDLIEHINDPVSYWSIREDGAMFVRLCMDEKAEKQFSDDYVQRWDRFNPKTRPYLFSSEMDDFMDTICGSSEYMHPYGDPQETHHYGDDGNKENAVSM